MTWKGFLQFSILFESMESEGFIGHHHRVNSLSSVREHSRGANQRHRKVVTTKTLSSVDCVSGVTFRYLEEQT